MSSFNDLKLTGLDLIERLELNWITKWIKTELWERIQPRGKLQETLIGLGILFVGTQLYYYQKFSFWSKRNVRSPRAIPFLGNYHSLLRYSFQDLSIKWAKEYGKVYGYYAGSSPYLVIADAKVLKQICIKDFDIFPNHNLFNVPNRYQKYFLLVQRDNHWKAMRAIITPTFTTGRIKTMYKILNQCVEEMIESTNDKLNESSHIVVDIREEFGTVAIDCAVGSFYGIKLDKNEDQTEMINSKRYFSMRALDAFRPSFLRFALANTLPLSILQALDLSDFSPRKMSFFYNKALKIIEHRLRSNERPADYLQLLLEARATESNTQADDELLLDRKQGHYVYSENKSYEENLTRPTKMKLTDEEVACQVVMLMLVATSTTATLMSNVVYLLAHHKSIQRRLFEELLEIRKLDDNGKVYFEYEHLMVHQYLDCVISEALRLMPPALRVDRQSSEEYFFQDYGFSIPKNSIVFIDFYALHQNPEYWPEPEKFDPERFNPENKLNIIPGSYSPFGLGPRACIGLRFALTEAKLALAKSIIHFEYDPAPGTKYPPEARKLVFIGNEFKDLRVSIRQRS